MFQSSCSFLGASSVPWDTNFARRFLRIPEEERKILDGIPGWSVDKGEEPVTDGEKSPLTAEKSPTALNDSDSENQSTNTTDKNSDEHKNTLPHNFHLSLKEKSTIASSDEKHRFMQSISLYANKVVRAFSGRKRSNSLSNIPLAKLEVGLSSSKSETSLENISYNISTEKSSLPKFEQTSENVNKATFEKLDTRIINHPLLKDVSSATKDVSKNCAFPTNLTSRENLLSKRLKLLEKRFSLIRHKTSPEERTCTNKDTIISLDLNPINSGSFQSVPVIQPSVWNSNPTNSGSVEPVPEVQSSTWNLNSTNSVSVEPILEVQSSTWNLNTTNSGSVQPVPEVQPSAWNLNTFNSEPAQIAKVISLPDLVCDNQLMHFSKDVYNRITGLPSVLPSEEIAENEFNIATVGSQEVSPNFSRSLEIVSDVCSRDAVCDHKGIKSPSAVPDSMNLSLITIDVSSGKAIESQKEPFSDVNPPSQSVEDIVNLNPVECIDSEELSSMPSKTLKLVPNLIPPAEDCASEVVEMLAVESHIPESCAVLSSLEASPFQSHLTNRAITKSGSDPKNIIKKIVHENTDVPFGSFPESINGWATTKNSGSCKIGRKRKRHNKDDTRPHKKSSFIDSLVHIQFTDDQLKNMIQIVKELPSDEE